MLNQQAQTPIVFSTEDGLVTLTFLVGVDPNTPQGDPLVTAEIQLFWEGSSPPEPITTEVRMLQPATVAHISDNGYSLDGTLTLQTMSSGQVAIFADLNYGNRDDHHVTGVVGIFTPDQG